jgi:hypothetical protein
MSKVYADPDWIPVSTLFTDFAGTRLFFQTIFGSILKYMSFENLAFFGRLFGYIMLSFPIAAISKHLRINNITLIFWLSVFYFPQQSFFAGEEVFGGFETKTIAYIFVFWSISFLQRQKIFTSIVFSIIAIHWHMLVGGWYTFYLLIYLFITIGKQRNFYYYWLFAGLILLPFVVYIYTGLVSDNENIINGLNIGQLYAYDRNPHHVGLLKSWDYFLERHAGKVTIAFIALILATTYYRKKLPLKHKWLNNFLIIILAQNFLFLIIALFDKNGFIAKFYPWRGSLLAMFFFQLVTTLLISRQLIPKFYLFLKLRFPLIQRKTFFNAQMSLILFFTLIILTFTTINRFKYTAQYQSRWDEVDILALNLKNVSDTGDTFIFLEKENRYTLSIPRKAEKDVYYFFGCIPSQTKAIYEWHQRGKIQEKIKKDIDYLVESGLNKEIDFVISSNELKEDFLEQVYNSDNYKIYKIIEIKQ